MLNVFLVRSNLSNSLLMQVRLGKPLLWKVEGERLSSIIVRKTSSQSSLAEIIITFPYRLQNTKVKSVLSREDEASILQNYFSFLDLS